MTWDLDISYWPVLMLAWSLKGCMGWGFLACSLICWHLRNIDTANFSQTYTIKDYCRSRSQGDRCCWYGLDSLPQVCLHFFKILDTTTLNRLATIYSWMEQLAARFPHLVSLKVSNLFLMVSLKVSFTSLKIYQQNRRSKTDCLTLTQIWYILQLLAYSSVLISFVNF